MVLFIMSSTTFANGRWSMVSKTNLKTDQETWAGNELTVAKLLPAIGSPSYCTWSKSKDPTAKCWNGPDSNVCKPFLILPLSATGSDNNDVTGRVTFMRTIPSILSTPLTQCSDSSEVPLLWRLRTAVNERAASCLEVYSGTCLRGTKFRAQRGSFGEVSDPIE